MKFCEQNHSSLKEKTKPSFVTVLSGMKTNRISFISVALQPQVVWILGRSGVIIHLNQSVISISMNFHPHHL